MFRFQLDDDAELRLLQERHAEGLFALVERNRARFRQWIPWTDEHTTLQHSKDRIAHDLEMFAENGAFLAGIWVRGRLDGAVGFHSIDWTNKSTDIHYWVDADCQGKGLVTRSCRAMLEYAFGELGLNRMEIHCDPLNLRSRAVAERLGFTQEGIMRERTWRNDRFADEVIYSILASEWESLRGRRH